MTATATDRGKQRERPRGVVAVAASAGGVEALSAFVNALPADFPAAVLVVLHIPSAGPSVLPGILARAGRLPARHPDDNDPLMPGVVLAAPPDRHLSVADSRVRVLTGPRENGHRPSADTLMRSVAQTFGPRAAGVILSGTMDDGAAGLAAIRAVGGLALVQDPREATFPGMPLAAIDETSPTDVCLVADMGDRLCKWLDELEKDMPEDFMADIDPLTDETNDTLTPFTCPECGGTLWLRDDYGAKRFRCRVGHTFSAEGLLLGKRAALEAALWAAVVALEEKADLTRRIIKRTEHTGRESRVARYRKEVEATTQSVEFLQGVIRDLVESGPESYHDDEGRMSAGTGS